MNAKTVTILLIFFILNIGHSQSILQPNKKVTPIKVYELREQENRMHHQVKKQIRITHSRKKVDTSRIIVFNDLGRIAKTFKKRKKMIRDEEKGVVPKIVWVCSEKIYDKKGKQSKLPFRTRKCSDSFLFSIVEN